MSRRYRVPSLSKAEVGVILLKQRGIKAVTDVRGGTPYLVVDDQRYNIDRIVEDAVPGADVIDEGYDGP